jgi:hypothetical protein
MRRSAHVALAQHVAQHDHMLLGRGVHVPGLSHRAPAAAGARGRYQEGGAVVDRNRGRRRRRSRWLGDRRIDRVDEVGEAVHDDHLGEGEASAFGHRRELGGEGGAERAVRLDAGLGEGEHALAVERTRPNVTGAATPGGGRAGDDRPLGC